MAGCVGVLGGIFVPLLLRGAGERRRVVLLLSVAGWIVVASLFAWFGGPVSTLIPLALGGVVGRLAVGWASKSIRLSAGPDDENGSSDASPAGNAD